MFNMDDDAFGQGGGSGKSASNNKLTWVTLFDNMNKKAEAKEAKPIMGDGKEAPKGKKGKRMSVERIYQKKTQLEHILLRPDTYIGSVEPVTQNMWVYDKDAGENGGLAYREITFVPGLYKIFDEILVNAADNKQRDAKMDCIKITIDSENNQISIWNNGKGIPVIVHQVEKIYVPELIFGHLLTSSNYNDEERKVTGGRNGYGAKLCNIFSKKFTVSTASSEYGKQFKQTWKDNMGKKNDAHIKDFSGKDFTEISFQPDLTKFKMEKLDRDTVSLMTRRAYDIAGSSKGVKVYLNGKRLPVSGFRDYVDLYVKDKTDEQGSSLKVIQEVVNDRWHVCLTLSETGFQQVSFVNSIATTKGGRHVDYVVDQVVDKLMETVKKKNKGGVNIRPFQIKSHLWVFVNALIENPSFDSQTKENMTLQVKKFGSTCKLSDKFIKQTMSCGVVESITNWMRIKAQTLLNKKCSATKHSKLKGIPKLDDANDAGTRGSRECTLILTEGDSAKTLAVSGLSVVGRDKYGVFPLRGKMLNVREATHKQIMENAEINSVIKIMGLQYKKSYDSDDALKTLRYGKLMIMTDQDQDGSHIKGLLINFIHHNWPSLLKQRFMEEFITPIVKVSKGGQSIPFYSLPEFEEWKKSVANHQSWKIKYYKGLGTSTNKEAKEYFCDMSRHRIPFKYSGPNDDAAITLAFSKKKVEERKEWLTDWLHERKKRREDGLSDLYLYNKDTRYISYNDFVNKELVLFSNADNERSIPSMVDGLKPGQRKVLFTCFKRNDKREVKVAQLAGSVAERSAYHHGEQSLMGTIINLAQNFIGSNNLNLLQPIGQFGTRLHGGKDAASPRYIFTMLSPLARMLFPVHDDPRLSYLYDDNQQIEPEWYCPIIPTVLVNGADGIGTGWSTKIANYDVREVVANVRRMIEGEEPVPMMPSYKNYQGSIEEIEENRYVCNGEIAIIDNNTIEINELPIRSWTQAYKEAVLEPMLHGSEKVQPMITDYKEYHTDSTVRFVIKMSEDKLFKAEEQGLHKVFKLQTTISQTNSVLFDANGCIRKYENVLDILREFFDVRHERYRIRKEYMEGMLAAESNKLDNQARFILEKIEGTIVIENKKKKDVMSMLVQRGYDSDPVKAWKESQDGKEDVDDDDDTSSLYSVASGSGPDFGYLLNMPLMSLSKEKKDELLKHRDAKSAELEELRLKTPNDLWRDDLDTFSAKLNEVEEQERLDDMMGITALEKNKSKKGRKKVVQQETKPSPMGRRVVPKIDVALKKKEGGGKRGRKKDVKMEVDGDDVVSDLFGTKEDSNEPLSLVERLNKKGIKTDMTGKTKEKKQGTLSFKSAAKKPAAKRKPKRNPWSSASESDAMDIDSDSDMDFDVAPKERTPRRTAAKSKKYTFSDDEDEAVNSVGKSSQDKDVFDDEDDSFKIPSDKGFDDDDDSDFGPKPTKKTTAPKRTTVASDSEDDIAPITSQTTSSKPSQDTAITLDSDDSYSPVKAKPKPKETKKEPKKKTLGKKATAVGQKDKGQPSIVAAMSKSKAPAKRKKDDSDSDVGKPKKKAPKAVSELPQFSSDSDLEGIPERRQPSFDSDTDDYLPVKETKKPERPKTKTKPKPKPKSKSPWSDSENDSDGFTAKPKTTKAKPKPKSKNKWSDSENDSDGFTAKPKTTKAKAKPKPKAKSKWSDSEDDSDGGFTAKPKASKAKAKPKPKSKSKWSESDDDSFKVDESIEVVPRSRPGRARAPAKYNFGESSGDSDF